MSSSLYRLPQSLKLRVDVGNLRGRQLLEFLVGLRQSFKLRVDVPNLLREIVEELLLLELLLLLRLLLL